MNTDNAQNIGQVPGSTTKAHTIAAHSHRQTQATDRPEPDRRDRAVDNYDAAHAELLEHSSLASGRRGDRNAAGGAALAGLLVMAVSGVGLAWWLGLLVAVGCGALAGREHALLTDARDRCRSAVQVMCVEHRIAKKAGAGSALPRPRQTCS